MTELGPSERQLLSALRVADDPTDEDRDRVHAEEQDETENQISHAASPFGPAAALWQLSRAVAMV